MSSWLKPNWAPLVTFDRIGIIFRLFRHPLLAETKVKLTFSINSSLQTGSKSLLIIMRQAVNRSLEKVFGGVAFGKLNFTSDQAIPGLQIRNR